MISWKHFVPSYVRNELKKKTGIVIDENGNQLSENNGNDITSKTSLEEMVFKKKDQTNISLKKQNQTKYTPIASYKPQGSLVYNDELINTLENKFN
jgi:hypothetical protein